MSLTIRVGILAALASASGCVVNPYQITFDGAAAPQDAGVGSEVVPGMDLGDMETLEGGCLPEICNNEDDDCNGITDDVPASELQNDPNNCGTCRNRCFVPNSDTCGVCVDGDCQFPCCSGNIDCVANLPPEVKVCETDCIPRGTEICNEEDDNCDCTTDEGFDKTMDPTNCGVCGRVCTGLNAMDFCVNSICDWVCDCDTTGVMPCFANVLSVPPGCEYPCPQVPIAGGPYPDLDERDGDGGADEPEVSCDAIDNDCDGVIDDGNPGGGADCGETEGECEAGTETCVFGAPICLPDADSQLPETEICDNLDNDCDSFTDNGFDKLNDPRYCGDCTPCVRPNTFTDCNNGSCDFVACHPGYLDFDGDGTCEYLCTVTGPEICDGVDNDCNTVIDDGLGVPPPICSTLGACAGTDAVCAAGPCDPIVKWRCNYNAPAETDPTCGTLVPQETLCDDVDGDCDGVIDDHEPTKGDACDDGELGVCRGTGNIVCEADNTGVECIITSPGGVASAEVCDGTDEDCDGTLDNGAPNTMVPVNMGGFDFWIDAYEASRPDATAGVAGTMEHRSCSVAGVLPWANATWIEANQACQDAGYRLCTEAEWQEACEGPSNLQYPYGMGYDPDACNGNDYDPDCTGFDDDDVQPTGTPYGCPAPGSSICESDYLALDLSGNLKEWTSTQVGSSPVTYRVRGGSYDNSAGALTCDFDFTSNEPDFFYFNLGFRCCSDTAP